MSGDNQNQSPFAEHSEAVGTTPAPVVASGVFLPSSPALGAQPTGAPDIVPSSLEEVPADTPFVSVEKEEKPPIAPEPSWEEPELVNTEAATLTAEPVTSGLESEPEASPFEHAEPVLATDDPFAVKGSMLSDKAGDAPMAEFSLSTDSEPQKTEESLDFSEDVEPIPTQVEEVEAPATNIGKANTVFYDQVLRTLLQAKDLGIDAIAKARIEDLMASGKMPQLICRDLVNERVINRIQLARAIARSQQRREITSFLDVPQESINMRRDLERKVCNLLRERRVIPLKRVEVDTNNFELHLAHETGLRDHMLESALGDAMPGYNFVWHFAMREVAGAYWLAGESEDIDAGMEAEALLDRLISNAIDARSSDIHIDPSIKGEPRAIVKYRIDGSIQPKEVITLDQLERLRVRIENIARMPKVDHRHPNKGAFTRGGYDWRVQVQPHAGRQGAVPRIVMRRLQPDVMPLETLGYPADFIEQIKSAARAPNGVIFWTGPTSSGKTESIHAAVVSVNPMARGLSVHTIEDPPEKRVSGYAVQMEIAEEDPERTGLQLLKSSLRADPDVVIFGEVRDAEMGGLVFEAANTGHLVFSTLHTNTAIDALVRLDELGVQGFLLSYIRGIAAQRLVRRLCTHCRQPMEEPDEYTHYVFDKYGVDMEGATLYTHNPDGCASCNFKGYHGLIAAAEWLVPSKELIEASQRRDFGALEEIAKRTGWRPMGYMGVLHIKNGITDAAELSSKILELAGETL